MKMKYKIDGIVELAKDLIRIPSVTGNEEAIACFVKQYMTDHGFDAIVNYHNTVIGILRGKEGPTILLDAHIDTVDSNPDEWKHHPYSGDVENSKIYGRGASDMKGALAAMLVAGKILAEERHTLKGNLVITGTSWEEYFEGYTLGKATDYLFNIGLNPNYVIIGEASELNIKRGQRGRTRIYFDVEGKAAHSAHPDAGINAVYKAMPLIAKIREMHLPVDDFLGKGIVELIGVETLPRPVDSVVPYRARISYDLRLLPGETKNTVLERFQKIIDEIKKEDADFDVNFCIASGKLQTTDGKTEVVEAFPPAWKLPEKHELVQKSRLVLESIGLKPKITEYGFCTNGSYSAGVAGIPTIGFGPGKERTAHLIDEFVEIGEMERACAGYVAIVKELLRS